MGDLSLTLRSCLEYPKYGITAYTFLAAALFNASTITNNSNKFSLTGLLVDCTTKQSLPLTLSFTSTKISPSLNLFISRPPSLVLSFLQIASANGILDVPENIFMLFTI